jgi:Lrp/AsnC family transcriptional regulator for asnA, asnC and gidA
MPTELDERDEVILECLEQDSRQTTQAIADVLSMPRVTVHDRIRRMKERGVIRKFTIEKDARALGLNLRAFLFLRCEGHQIDRRRVSEQVASLGYVVRCDIITGDWDILVEAVAPSMDVLGDSILDEISSIEGIGATQTMVSFYHYEGKAGSFR